MHDLPVCMHGLRSGNIMATSVHALGTKLMEQTGRPFVPIEATSNSAEWQTAFHVSPLRSPAVRHRNAFSSGSSVLLYSILGHGIGERKESVPDLIWGQCCIGRFPEQLCLEVSASF